MSTTETQNGTPVEAGLTVDELRAQLDEISAAGGGAQKTFVQYRPASPPIGPSAAMSVVQASSGFDWNQGRVFLHTEKMLSADEAELSRVRDKASKLANTHFLARRVLEREGISDEERVKLLCSLFPREQSPSAPRRVKNN